MTQEYGNVEKGFFIGVYNKAKHFSAGQIQLKFGYKLTENLDEVRLN